MNELEAAFHQYFEIIRADTPELLEEVFSLRFKVLCVDNAIPGFNSVDYPDRLEIDEYDHRSIHILLRHQPSGTFIGTARLVLPDTQNLENKFPAETYSQFFPESTLKADFRQHTAEISRFFIVNNFFKRKNETGMLSPLTNVDNNIKERRHFPHPMLGLAVGIIRLCKQYEIYYWLSSMNPALNRLLGLYSMQLDPIGPLINHHGLRAPYHVCIFNVLDRMHRNHRAIWELVTNHGNIWPADLTSLRTKNKSQPAPDNICIPG